jgi:tetratricopeptide (TPR) repeat protein
VRLGIFALALAAAAAPTAEPGFEELSAKARQAYEANRSEDALALYGRAVKLRPDWAQGWWALGMINYELDRYPACRDALTRMVAADAAAAPGWALLGLCEFRTKEYDASFNHLKRAHMLVGPRQGRAPLLDMADYHLGLLLTRQGAFEVAQEVLLKVALSVRNNPEMVFGCGLSALRLPILPAEVTADQKPVIAAAGKAFWDVVAGPPEQARAEFVELAAKYPSFPNVHYLYGTYLAAHFPEQAAAEFTEELRVSPDSVPARVQLVLRYVIEGKLEEALQRAREAVALSPDSVGSQLALAQTLRARGDEEGALTAFLKAKKLDPVSPKIRWYLMSSYRALGRLEDARREQADYERLKAEQPNWP